LATKSLTVNNNTYDYPADGEDPGWGAEATGWAEEVTNTLDSLLGAGDILETPGEIANNQSVALDVLQLAFEPTVTRSAVVTYSIYRNTDSASLSETGTINILYDASQPTNEKWVVTQSFVGNAGVIFTITDAGQFQYTSTNMAGTGYVNKFKFKATTTSAV